MKDITTAKKVTLKDRKKAQPNAVLYLSDTEKNVIKNTVAKDLTDAQFNVFIYTSQALGLNPLLNEIAVILYAGKMSIQVMRDGFLTIAHRSRKFAGLESGIYEEGDTNYYGRVIKIKTAWSKAYNKDFIVPVYQEAEFIEYDASSRNALWKTKPNTMIKKVAESMALRKAFNINGVYAPEEMEKEVGSQTVALKTLELENGDLPITQEQIKTIQAMDPEFNEEELKVMTKQQGAETIQKLASK